jgi:ribosome biogenesis protein UTP30
LKAKFGQYEAQRKLFSEHDLFLADDRIINRLPKVLGKTFFKTTQKRPIPVVLQAKAPKVDGKRGKREKPSEGAVNAAPAGKIAKEIQKAVNSALVSLAPTTNTAVRIGWASFTAEQIADNVDAVATALVEKWVPQKWRNVRSIHIKGPETAALPIWMTDELWLSEQDVVADGREEEAAAAQIEGPSKKRKKTTAANDEDDAPKTTKKSKKVSAAKDPVPDGNDEQLDKQIAERKTKLKKQKAAAKKAMDD